LDDGAYLITKIIILLARLKKDGRDFDFLLSSLKQPAEELEIRLAISGGGFLEYGNQIIADLTEHMSQKDGFTVADDSREGVRVSDKSGWFLLRMSVHDPIMPLNIESDIAGGAKKLAGTVYDFLKKYERLDVSWLLCENE
jgi:phosphomannomutase